MNSVVRPIFNESFVEKMGFVGLVNSAQDPLENLEKKKKKGRHRYVECNPDEALVQQGSWLLV